MRISEAYGLGLSQAELDFVDVDTVGDARLFVDPRALLLLNDDWGAWCVSLLQELLHRSPAAPRRGSGRRGEALGAAT